MSIGSRLLGLEHLHLGRRASLIAAGSTLALLFAGTALVFAAIALHVTLAERLGPVEAALWVAGVAAILFCLTAALTAAAVHRARRKARAALNASLMAVAAPPVLSLAWRHAGATALAVVALAAFLKGRQR